MLARKEQIFGPLRLAHKILEAAAGRVPYIHACTLLHEQLGDFVATLRCKVESRPASGSASISNGN